MPSFESLHIYIILYMGSDAVFSRPVEILQVHLTPSDFFTQNPAIDVPCEKDNGSVLLSTCCESQT